MYEMDIQSHRQTVGERFKDRDKDRLTGDTEPKTGQPSGQMRQFAAPSKSAKYPAGQSWGWALPAGHCLAAGQITSVSTLDPVGQ